MLALILNILATPAMLVGILALIGLVLQKKPVEEIVKGTVKCIVGFLVLSAGASFLQSGSLLSFGDVFNYAFNMQGVVPNNEAIVSYALQDFGKETAYIMALGMILNIILARFSRLKYIFLTGHHTLYMAAMIAVLCNIGGLSGLPLYIGGGMLLALISAISPAICEPTMEKIVETDELALGHFGGFGYWFSAQCAKLFAGDKDNTTEDIEFPQRLTFLRDTTVSIGITMIMFFMIVTGIAVAKGILAEDPQVLLASYPNLGSLLNVGSEIVSEIVPAFRGIAERLVPGAVPAIDCPVVFPYAPNAVLIGFLVSFVGGIVGLVALSLINKSFFPAALILPGVVPHFFCGAVAGVFGNAEGGIKGCVFGSFLHGMLITFLPAICMPVMGALNFANCTFSDADFSVLGILFGNAAQRIQGFPLLMLCIVLYAAPIVFSLAAPKKAASGEEEA